MNNQLNPDDDVEDGLPLAGGSTLRSYLELARLPNVFTAMADVAMGFLFAQATDWQWDPQRDSWALAALMAASSLLYIAGVVLNDVFDLETDRRQRPERPLPSGRVSSGTAQWLGWQLLAVGLLFGAGAGLFTGGWRPSALAAALAVCIVLYDAWLKRTPLGPLAMGACRTLNVLLGMVAASASWGAEHWLVAGGLGIYVAGITLFARRESQQSSRLQLMFATLAMSLGIALLAWFPSWSQRTIFRVLYDPQHWYLLTGLLGMLIVWRCLWAVVDPSPARVRMAVAHCVLSIIMLDAVACYAVRGVPWACAILVLLLPAMFLGRWIKIT